MNYKYAEIIYLTHIFEGFYEEIGFDLKEAYRDGHITTSNAIIYARIILYRIIEELEKLKEGLK